MSSYILASIDDGGYIRAEAPYDWNAGMGYTDNHYSSGSKSAMIHRETIDLDKQDEIRCFARLEMAKEFYTPEVDWGVGIILGLNEHGGGESIWATSDQMETVKKRLKTWSGCYGAWTVRTLNG